MFKNHFIVALRNFWRNRTFSLINVSGLSIGISAALVIFLIVYYEFSYDKFEPDRDRIYRVTMEMKFDGNEGHGSAVPAPLGAAIEAEVTGVEQTVPVFQFQGDATAKVAIASTRPGEPVVYKGQPNIVFTNPQYFYLVPFKWLAGSPESSLKAPFSVVLTESRARQYFPSMLNADIIGKEIVYNDDLRVTVSGIVKDLDQVTDLASVEFISLATIGKTELRHNFMMEVWNDWMAYSQLYIKLSRGSTSGNVEAQLNKLLSKYNKDANKDANNSMAFRLQPLSDVHFNDPGVGQRPAHKPTLYGLIAIAVFLLLLACINFINLTTAQASQRAKEIGIRKTMGSSKRQLVFQFLSETLLFTLIATISSTALTPLLMKVFADFIPPGLQFELLQPSLLLFLLGLVLVVSFFSGLYPALILSGYNPVAVLKGNVAAASGQTRKAGVRKTLTVAQFVIAQFFVIATVMVSKQIDYSINTDLGFKKEAILNFRTPRDTSLDRKNVLLQKINALPQVEMASVGSLPPAADGPAFTNIKYTDEKKEVKVDVQIRWGDTNYLKLYHIKLLAGRNVQQSDTIKEFLINEKYARVLGFMNPADALGKTLDFNKMKMPIVGVMQDFHERSLHEPIDPIVFASFVKRSGDFHVALKPQNAAGTNWPTAIAGIEKAYKELYPENDFSYAFLDESIARFYKSEQDTARLLKWATGLTVFISCLGLLGLVIFTTNTRTKEISIRKIMGASVVNIITILSKDFVRLVVIAFVIAVPVAWWAINKWLQDFAYKTAAPWWLFILCGIALLSLALITLSVQTIKTAVSNPVKSLRVE